MHKLRNVLHRPPKRLQVRAKEMLHEIMGAPDKSAREAIARFGEDFKAKYAKAVDSLMSGPETQLALFDFPAQHWRHLRTTNPIESLFVGVKARTRQTKGAGSRKAGLAMAFKLAVAAEAHWREVSAPHLVAFVPAGVQVPRHVGEHQSPEVEERPQGVAA